MIRDVLVLGGGAAGLMCAITAAGRGRKVTVIEGAPSVGRKILVSGGGRCNFTNTGASAANYLGRNPDFHKSALSRFTPADFVAMVERHGISYHEKKSGQLFCDHSSRGIVKMLVDEALGVGVEILTQAPVLDVEKTGCFRVRTACGELESRTVVVATGGLSLPKLGATDAAFRIAKHFGLPVVEPRPGLVGLRFDENERARFGRLSGLSFEVVARCGAAEFRENALVTHRGLSGPAILQVSSFADSLLPVELDLLPGKDAAKWLREDLRTPVEKRLSQVLPARFAAVWAEEFAPRRPLAQAGKMEFDRLASALNHWAPRFPSTDGYAKAEVTVGGVDTSFLSSKTMECRHAPGLFFLGECVDVTGWLGGYNFQWAWASGYAAGLSV